MCGVWGQRRRRRRRRGSDEIRNPKTEYRRKPEIRGPKSEAGLCAGWISLRPTSVLGFRVLRISFGFRPSGFGFPFMSLDLKYVDEAVALLGRAPDSVIPILQALQDHYLSARPDECVVRGHGGGAVMKSEYRIPNTEGSLKSEARNPKPACALDGYRCAPLRISDFGLFGFPSDFGLRVSDFRS